MKLYLVQHGLAFSDKEDPRKSLTPQGISETKKVAEFLKKIDIKLDCLWHSNKLRAIQTAEIISKSLKVKEVKEREDLAPLAPVDKILSEILSKDLDLMIVGHLPFLGKLASVLLVNREDLSLINFKNSSVLALENDGANFKICWFITPEILTDLGKAEP